MHQLDRLWLAIPANCPFARTIAMGPIKVVVPPLCKLNPSFNFLMRKRMEALERQQEQTNI